MLKLLIIADDFTGALDTGVQFSKKNISTFVTSDIDITADKLALDTEVLVIDSESRHLHKEKAYNIVKNIIKNFKNIPNLYFYKKTDSTLRGNIGAELSGFMDGLSIDEMYFIPALPKSGRTTKKGKHYVNNVLLENSVFVKDPLNPTTKSYIPDIIAEQCNISSTICEKPSECKKTHFDNKKNITIFDAETDADLKEIGDVLSKEKKLHYTSGCAGFGEVLSNLINFSHKEFKTKISSKEILFICGSVNQVSLDQTAYAKKQKYQFYTLSPMEELSLEFIGSKDFLDLTENIIAKIKSNGKFLIETLDSYDKIKETNDYAKSQGIPLNDLGLRVAENIGSLIKSIYMKYKIENLIVFGGDTLISIIQKLGFNGLIPCKEISPGVVFAKANSENKDLSLNIITKAGGFGAENVITEIENFIKSSYDAQ